MSEHQQQSAVVAWYRVKYPYYAKCLYSVPNGSVIKGDKIYRIKKIFNLKKEGFKSGVSDLFLMVARGRYHGLVLEMKDVKKTISSVSDDQMEHLLLAQREGYCAAWAAGATEAIEIIENYMAIK